MKTKKIFLTLIKVFIGLSFITTSAWAGSTQRHRWEGVAIATPPDTTATATTEFDADVRRHRRASAYAPLPNHSSCVIFFGIISSRDITAIPPAL
jgi:hypothetical protein